MACFIYINGYPGVGKLTVAIELQKIIPNSRVYHNHLMIDPVAPLVERDSPEYNTIRMSFRRHILNIIATSEAIRGVTWIFTDSRSTSPGGSSAAWDYALAARKRGVPFVPVILNCEVEENMMRAVNESRSTTKKLKDTNLIRKIREDEELYRFGGEEELELDITELAAREAAERIAQHASDLLSKQRHGSL